MTDIKTGDQYRFAYPEAFKLFPEYSAHRGQTVKVIRPMRDGDEYCGPETDPEAGEYAFLVRAPDGWEGMAFESELQPI